ncbi:MAG: hypothetical protein AAF639_07515 [Chloroflexota bacterium]
MDVIVQPPCRLSLSKPPPLRQAQGSEWLRVDVTLRYKALSTSIGTLLDQVEHINEQTQMDVIPEGFDTTLYALVSGWVTDARNACAHHEFEVALYLIVQNLYEVEFNVSQEIADLALAATQTMQLEPERYDLRALVQ